MDPEKVSSIALHELAPRAGVDLRVSLPKSRKQETRLTGAQVTPLQKQDPSLQKEAREAASIAQRIRSGDVGAESAMIERYSKGLRYLLTRRIGDEERARDLLQDTFYIAITKLRETDIENPERLAGYLRGIAVRVAQNAGRRKQRDPYPMDVAAIQSIPDHEPRQFEHVARNQTLAAVHKLLDSMPVKRDREILRRLYVHDQDKQEICDALGLESLHFNRVLFRAKKRFRKLLERSRQVADLAPG